MTGEGWKIRTANSRDSNVLSSLGVRSFTETFGHLYKPEDLALFLEKSHSVAAYERLLSDPACQLWVAEINDGPAAGEAIGYCVVGPTDLPLPDRPASAGELQRLYILQDHQGGGLGVRMLTRALDWLEARFEHLYLSVYAENIGAQRLYQRHGFEKVHDYHFMVGNHADPEWIMVRRS